jgi:hypothetical protein
MEITPHLTEAELAEFVSDPSRGLGTHLELCDTCLQEVARLREAVAEMRPSGNQPEEFWSTQRAAIRSRMTDRPSASALPRLAWAGAMAVAVLAGLLLNNPKPAPRPVARQVEQQDADHALLLAVERVMRSNGPAALEPATYFVREISQDAPSNPTSSKKHKEISNEN